MSTFLVLAPFVVVLAIMLLFGRRPVNCPDCGARLPWLVSPLKKTRRIWLAGGYLCPNCGCETDLKGQKVTAATPAAPFPKVAIALLAAALLIGVGLVEVASLFARPAPPPPVATARVMEPAPMAAPV